MGVAKNRVNDEDWKPIFMYFQKVLRSPTTDSFNQAFKELSAISQSKRQYTNNQTFWEVVVQEKWMGLTVPQRSRARRSRHWRLGDFASGQDDRRVTSQFCHQTVLDADIVEVGINEYHVFTRWRLARLNRPGRIVVCYCTDGKERRHCGHLAAVEKKFDFWVTTRPVSSVEERAAFNKITFKPNHLETFIKKSSSRQWGFEKVNEKCEPE